MRSRVAIIAALPREIASLVHGWRADENSAARGVFLAWSESAIVVCAGMGRARAHLAVEEALACGQVHRLISAGWCGALRSGIMPGTVHRPSRVVDQETGRAYSTGEAGGVLVTSTTVAGHEEKQRLAQDCQADLVDMEASAVAEYAAQRGIPFMAVKAVSDGHDFELPGLEKFVTAEGSFRESAFAAHLALRPVLWTRALQMARASSLAAKNLSRELRIFLEQESNLRIAQPMH
jgi:adenosylhomocysteine nucleosidase